MIHPKYFTRTTRSGSWISLEKNNVLRLLDLHFNDDHSLNDLNDYLVAHNKCGGLIAVYLNKSAHYMERQVFLYTSMLTPNALAPSITVKHHVVFMCWNDVSDHLILVFANKSIYFFNYKGEVIAAPVLLDTLPQIFAATGCGLVGVTPFLENFPGNMLFLHYSGPDGYITKHLQLPTSFPITLETSALLVVPLQHSESGFPEVYLSVLSTNFSSDIFHCLVSPVMRCSKLKISLTGCRIKLLSLSPDGNRVAILSEDGVIYCTNRSFDQLVPIGNVGRTCLSRLAWCGCESVVCLSSGDAMGADRDSSASLFLLSAAGFDIVDRIDDLPLDTLLLPECDGLRLLSSSCHQFLQFVPSEVQRVFSVGSRAPGAVLLSTFDAYMSGDASAVMMIRRIQQNVDGLIEAIHDCIVAANYEFHIAPQKRLLRIANFGRSFCPTSDSDFFVNVTRRLRVRNTLRTCSAAVLITHAELCLLGEERLLQRLVAWGKHQVASFVCVSLGIKRDDLLYQWALAKLARVGIDTELEKKTAKFIVRMIKKCGVFSFAELARLASGVGRRSAALVFLEAEANPLRQIPMLLSLGEAEMALNRALLANDADCIFTVVSHFIGNQGARCVPFLAAQKDSRASLLQYTSASEIKREVMVEFYKRYPDHLTLISLRAYLEDEQRLRSALDNPRRGAEGKWLMFQECKRAALQSSVASVKRYSEEPVGVKTYTPHFSFSPTAAALSSTNERFLLMHLSVIQTQTTLMGEFNDERFLTASIVDLIRLTLEHGSRPKAEKLKVDFNVSEKTFQWCMLQAYTCTGQWDLVDDLGGVKSQTQPLIDGEHFVSALLAYHRPQQASQYIPRIARIEQRMEYYVQCGDWTSAGADCRRNCDANLLLQLRERAKGNQDLLEKIDQGWSRQEGSLGRSFPKFF